MQSIRLEGDFLPGSKVSHFLRLLAEIDLIDGAAGLDFEGLQARPGHYQCTPGSGWHL